MTILIIESNTVHTNGSTGDQTGIHCTTCPAAIVRYNLSYGQSASGAVGGHGIQLDTDSDGAVAYYNICYGNDGGAISVVDSAAVEIYNNVGYDNGQVCTTEGGISLLGPVQDATTATVYNNIMYANNNSYAIYLDSATANNTLDIDTNIWYKAAGNWYYDGSSGGATLATWNALSYVGTDLNADPLMTDPASDDFTLQITSPCIDAGIPVYIDNIVTNDSFEDEDDWVDYGTGPTHSRGNTHVHSGTYSWDVLTGDADSGIQADTDVYGTITAGKFYEVSIWIYCSGGDTTATYGITDDGTGVLATSSSTVALTNGNWSHGTFVSECTTTGTARPFMSGSGTAWALTVDDFTIKERIESDYAGNVVTPPPHIGAYEDLVRSGYGDWHMDMSMGMN